MADTMSAVRKAIRARDGRTCKYCGTTEAYGYVVEHIIPVARGGNSEPYNLVMACVSCNIKKGRSVWVPRNLAAITADHPAWLMQITALADEDAERARVEAAARGEPLYADVPPTLKRAVDRIVFERGQAGTRTTLRKVIIEALQEYIERYDAQQQAPGAAGEQAGG